MTQTQLQTNGSAGALAPIEEPAGLPAQHMPPSMAIWFNDQLFERAKMIATYLSKAQGFVPPHLVGKPEACFAVVSRALTWKLDPYAVAQCTYQTPGGRVGFEGKLCQAILENSGKLEGPVKYEFYGDWSKVQGKFEIRRSGKTDKDYAAATWTRKDAEGLGVIVRAKVKGEDEPREWRFDLVQAFPLNSTLWATDPKTQICYTAVRRFGSVAAPGLFMGVPFDHEDYGDADFGPERAKDVTPPRPVRADFIDAEPDPQAAGHVDTEAEFRAAMSGRMPDTPEERGEAEEPPAEPEGDYVAPQPEIDPETGEIAEDKPEEPSDDLKALHAELMAGLRNELGDAAVKEYLEVNARDVDALKRGAPELYAELIAEANARAKRRK